jgi:hypothetical protein
MACAGVAVFALAAQAEVECHRTGKIPFSRLSEAELLRRLIFAETVSVGLKRSASCSRDSVAIMEAIAWGVRHRVGVRRPRLREVILEPGQFNPALSDRSVYGKFFRCPAEEAARDSELEFLWSESEAVVSRVLTSKIEASPFGSRGPGNFYYPLSSQASKRPPRWADLSQAQAKANYIAGVVISGVSFSHECVHFFAGRSQ